MRTAKPVLAGLMGLVQFYLASSLHISFVFDLILQAMTMLNFLMKTMLIFTKFMDTATVMH